MDNQKNNFSLMKRHLTDKHGEITDWEEFLKISKIKFEEKFHTKIPSNVTREDFEKLDTMGVGAFGRVFLVRHKNTWGYFAMKVLDKARVIKMKQISHCYNEKQILQCIQFPFCVNLEYFFQDKHYLYFIMPSVLGGELFRHLKKFGMLSENQAKFYAAQILLGLEYLHNLDLVYRDLKPENILLDELGYVKITDFGFCKHVRGRTYTLCGTPEYLAPEVILSKGYGKTADCWSFGVLVYEMVAGFAPFSGKDAFKIYKKVVKGKYKIPEGFSSDMRELIRNTLQTDVSRRYGTRTGSKDIRSLKWFKNTEWSSILNKRVAPPFVPKIKNQGDTSNFEKYDERSSEDDNDSEEKYTFDDEFAEF